MLPPMPPASTDAISRRPCEWERIIGVVVRDPDGGWGDESIFGAKDYTAPVSRAEFLQRAGLSDPKWSQ